MLTSRLMKSTLLDDSELRELVAYLGEEVRQILWIARTR